MCSPITKPTSGKRSTGSLTHRQRNLDLQVFITRIKKSIYSLNRRGEVSKKSTTGSLSTLKRNSSICGSVLWVSLPKLFLFSPSSSSLSKKSLSKHITPGIIKSSLPKTTLLTVFCVRNHLTRPLFFLPRTLYAPSVIKTTEKRLNEWVSSRSVRAVFQIRVKSALNSTPNSRKSPRSTLNSRKIRDHTLFFLYDKFLPSGVICFVYEIYLILRILMPFY
jgi:hypothetical protein